MKTRFSDPATAEDALRQKGTSSTPRTPMKEKLVQTPLERVAWRFFRKASEGECTPFALPARVEWFWPQKWNRRGGNKGILCRARCDQPCKKVLGLQLDLWHISAMVVQGPLDDAFNMEARSYCTGIGQRCHMLWELARRWVLHSLCRVRSCKVTTGSGLIPRTLEAIFAALRQEDHMGPEVLALAMMDSWRCWLIEWFRTVLPKSEEVYMKWGTGIHIDFTCPPISTDIASLLSIDILDIPVIIDTSRPAFCCW